MDRMCPFSPYPVVSLSEHPHGASPKSVNKPCQWLLILPNLGTPTFYRLEHLLSPRGLRVHLILGNHHEPETCHLGGAAYRWHHLKSTIAGPQRWQQSQATAVCRKQNKSPWARVTIRPSWIRYCHGPSCFPLFLWSDIKFQMELPHPPSPTSPHLFDHFSSWQHPSFNFSWAKHVNYL